MTLSADEELAMWKKFKAGDNEAKHSLLQTLMPSVKTRLSFFSNVPLPQPHLYGEALSLAEDSLHTWDPKQGARLSTHTVGTLQRMNRIVSQNKNVARIPEHKEKKVQNFLHERATFIAENNRIPSPEEMADHLSWNIKEVKEVSMAIRKTLSESSMPEAALGVQRDNLKSTMFFVRQSVATPDERAVFDARFGFEGKPILSVEKVSKMTGLSEGAVRRTENKLKEDINRYSMNRA